MTVEIEPEKKLDQLARRARLLGLLADSLARGERPLTDTEVGHLRRYVHGLRKSIDELEAVATKTTDPRQVSLFGGGES